MDRWRSEHELAEADWWTVQEAQRHLEISARTFRRYKEQGLAVVEGRVDGERVQLVKRIDVQRHYRGKRHAANSTRFQA